jgi:hypothetical protein
VAFVIACLRAILVRQSAEKIAELNGRLQIRYAAQPDVSLVYAALCKSIPAFISDQS